MIMPSERKKRQLAKVEHDAQAIRTLLAAMAEDSEAGDD